MRRLAKTLEDDTAFLGTPFSKEINFIHILYFVLFVRKAPFSQTSQMLESFF